MSKMKVYAPVKPARSYEAQAERMFKVHGLDVGDAERARSLFSTVNYYRLTTYGKHLRREDDPERFVDGVTLDMLYALYQFDMGLRHLLLPVLEFFEIQLRAKISYQLAMTYSSTGYLNAENFRQDKQSQSRHKDLLHKFHAEVRRQSDLDFVRHHRSKYGGKFPIWAAVELFTFGMIVQLYEIMKVEDQRAVCADYGLAPEELLALMDAAVEARNICAHYNRLYNRPLNKHIVLPVPYKRCESDRIFPLLLALRSVAGHERVYRQMARGLEQLTEDFPAAELALCGFPSDWRELLQGS